MTQSLKKLVIIRHAHRNKLNGGEADNGLSAKGKKQANALQKLFSRIFGRKKAEIYSSPKARCIETVQPIAKKIKVSLETLDTLNEATQNTKNDTELKEKVRAFHSLWQESAAPLTVICSHGDWIPAYFKQILGIELDLDKGGWVELEVDCASSNQKPQLKWMIQNPSLLFGSNQ